MPKICLILSGLLVMAAGALNGQSDYVTPFEQNDNYSAAYAEAIAYYETLARDFPDRLRLLTYGSTDAGYPLHLAVVSADGEFDPAALRAAGKTILLVNNAIHAGEPCGVDASMMLVRDLLTKKELQRNLSNVVVAVIPFYNIGGGLNRGSYSRANQNGPEAYGFRGNARNLNLNRDFIKCDTRNAQTFTRIFREWQPQVLVDNHTSNGADYQYSITLIPSQQDKLHPLLGGYMDAAMLPWLYAEMDKTEWEMTPYVMARGTPDRGISAYLDLPRLSSGYAALHNVWGFMPETHMLKPFRNRVWSVYHFMDAMIRFMNRESANLLRIQKQANEAVARQDSFALNWTPDLSRVDSIRFKGFTAKQKPSAISGQDRLYYDQSEPWEKTIPYYRYYRPIDKVSRPEAYVIPQAYADVIDRLQWNGVEMYRLSEDQELEVEAYYVLDYQTSRSPYEGHYLHSDPELEVRRQPWKYRKGDFVVFTNQPVNRYIIETLEPQGSDAFFSWNFFDGILEQKEYFSSYVFEDLAAAYLEENPELKARLEARKAEDAEFAGSGRAQLDFIYRNSPYYEPTHRRYPVVRLSDTAALRIE